MIVPPTKAIGTEQMMPKIKTLARVVLTYWPIVKRDSSVDKRCNTAMLTPPPISAKTMETVVEVGRPNLLKRFRSVTSVMTTAKKTIIRFSKEYISGL